MWRTLALRPVACAGSSVTDALVTRS
jgi:hypothetical protein